MVTDDICFFEQTNIVCDHSFANYLHLKLDCDWIWSECYECETSNESGVAPLKHEEWILKWKSDDQIFQNFIFFRFKVQTRTHFTHNHYHCIRPQYFYEWCHLKTVSTRNRPSSRACFISLMFVTVIAKCYSFEDCSLIYFYLYLPHIRL